MDPTPPILLTDEFFDLPFKCCAHYFYDILTSCGTLPDRTITLLYKYRFTPGFLQHPIDLLWTTSVTFLLSSWHLMILWHHFDILTGVCPHLDHIHTYCFFPSGFLWHLDVIWTSLGPHWYITLLSSWSLMTAIIYNLVLLLTFHDILIW